MSPVMPPVVYLHGFASSPSSNKAKFFSQRLAERGLHVEVPQLDQGDFRGLTITGQLRVIEQAAGDRPAILMGSSLGGYLAALYASTHPSIERLVLMAPALRFPSRWRARLADQLDRWKRDGSLLFFHFGFRSEQALGYQFVEDVAQYPEEPDFHQPALILHGTRDADVPCESSRDFAASHPNVTLRLYDSGHELTDVLEPMWEETARFLQLDHNPRK